jgi:hypothetical protein
MEIKETPLDLNALPKKFYIFVPDMSAFGTAQQVLNGLIGARWRGLEPKWLEKPFETQYLYQTDAHYLFCEYNDVYKTWVLTWSHELGYCNSDLPEVVIGHKYFLSEKTELIDVGGTMYPLRDVKSALEFLQVSPAKDVQ